MSKQVEKELQALADEAGELTPDLVLEAARDETSPLHSHFEWDDSEAAEKWRQEQARRLIRSVRIVYREATDAERKRTVRKYVSVQQPEGRRAYRESAEIAQDPVARRLVLADMEREWKTLMRKYGEYEEFVTMVAEDIKPK
jgi:hypothetical protein